MDANLYAGHINVDVKTGYQTGPKNPLNIKPETLALLAQNPEFREARSELFSALIYIFCVLKLSRATFA